MKLGIAADHRGYKLKNNLIITLEELGYNIIDYGTDSEESCDYPDYAYKLGMAILNHEVDFGIAICGSGIGISIALNKIKGIYCAKVDNKNDAYHTRCDNNTNCIAFTGEKGLDESLEIVKTFINTDFSNLDKHIRRINKVKQIENGEFYA